jgi:DNA repair protein RecO (recombination protein O)
MMVDGASRAILLRKSRFSDTSLIVSWMTADFGRIKTLAKGALQPKSRFAGSLDLFHSCEITFVRSRTSDLHALRECVLHPEHAPLRPNYLTLSMAAYFAELLELVTEQDHPVPEFYELLHRASSYLAQKAPTRRALEFFEEEVTRLAGIQHPGITAAMSIGRTFHRIPANRRELMAQLPE